MGVTGLEPGLGRFDDVSGSGEIRLPYLEVHYAAPRALQRLGLGQDGERGFGTQPLHS